MLATLGLSVFSLLRPSNISKRVISKYIGSTSKAHNKISVACKILATHVSSIFFFHFFDYQTLPKDDFKVYWLYKHSPDKKFQQHAKSGQDMGQVIFYTSLTIKHLQKMNSRYIGSTSIAHKKNISRLQNTDNTWAKRTLALQAQPTTKFQQFAKFGQHMGQVVFVLFLTIKYLQNVHSIQILDNTQAMSLFSLL